MLKATKKSTATTTTTTTVNNDMLYRSKLKVKASNNNCSNSHNELAKKTTASANAEATAAAAAAAAATTTTTTATSAIAHTSLCKTDNALLEASHHQQQQQQTQSPPLKKLSLRGNQLCGSILIGNYNYLTQLEVCENEMEILDLSSLAQLETLKCSRNKLMELMLNGSSLQTLIADNNCLHTITIDPLPLKLQHMDIACNDFTDLPSWIGGCQQLQSLDARHNQLANVCGFLRAYRIGCLRTLNLAYNRLQTLERLPEGCASVEQLYLQSNELPRLPENLFAVTHAQLRLLNAACNRLTALPRYEQNSCCALQELYLSGNQLTERLFDALVHAPQLRTLHVAYNRIGELSEACLRHWTELEVLVLSGNLLQHLPANMGTLTRLQVLRVHSNLLLATPTLAQLDQLKVLDLAHNHLDRVNLLSLVPPNLKYLDLSANLQLQVDAQQLKVCQSQTQKHWSLIDVSGRNRSALPTSMRRLDVEDEPPKRGVANQLKPPWLLGFAETPGSCRKLCVSQLRQPEAGLFGMFECAGSMAKSLAALVPRLLQQHQTDVKPAGGNLGDCLKYTLLTAQQQLSACYAPRQSDADADTAELHFALAATICHVSKEPARTKGYVRPLKSKRYVLRVASVGNLSAYMVRRTSNVALTGSGESSGSLLAASNGEQRLPDPDLIELTLSNEDEYLVLGNAKVWSVLDIDRVAREVRKEENALLAAKRLQDIAQSFGAHENLSVLVIRFRNIGTDVEHLIKELKQSVRKKPPIASLVQSTPSTHGVCKRTCCDRSNACRHRALTPTTSRGLGGGGGGMRSERSSPSGQSDQLHKDNGNGLMAAGDAGSSDEFVLAHARVLEEEETEMETLDETDSVLSEEQFKCWEYMLEQNTQLLFDKELNTISKSFTKNRNIERKINHANVLANGHGGGTERDRFDFKSNLMKSVTNKFISHSSPQLLFNETKKSSQPQPTLQQPQMLSQVQQQQQQQLSFLSKHFGSNRSFQHATGYNLFDSKSRDSLAAAAPYAKLGGGPNAAYFGSLQRLMPYNLEYDFAVTQERNILDEEEDDDYSEQESRMRKYWGVATTEL